VEAEVTAAYKRMRQCAPGLDGLHKACFAAGSDVLFPIIAGLFSYLLACGEVVGEWCLAVIVLIQKKGDSVLDLDNFRGITLASFMKQWYSMCLLARLEVVLGPHIPSVQQGFCKGGSCATAILAAYALIEKRWLQHAPVYAAYVDLKKAFPTVQRDILFAKLAKFGVSARILRAIMALYSGARGVVRTQDGYGKDFPIELGTLEGSVLSPLLFVAFIADFPKRLDAMQLKGGEPSIGGMRLRCIFFADDLVLLAFDPADLNGMLERWSVYCGQNHQQTSVPKTKIMVHRPLECRTVRVESGRCYIRKRGLRRAGDGGFSEFAFVYRGEVLEVVDVFTYLGCDHHDTAGLQFSYAARAVKGERQWGGLRGALKAAPHLPSRRAFELAECLVGGSILSSVECWGPFAFRALGKKGVPLWGSVFGWLSGIHEKYRSARLIGVIPVRNWRVELVARPLRWLECAGGCETALSTHVAWQLYENYLEAPRRSRRDTWLGTLQNAVISLDPRWACFSFAHVWQGDTALRLRMVAPRATLVSRGFVRLSQRLRIEACQLEVRSRFHDALVKLPTEHQQEYLFHRVVCLKYGLNPSIEHAGAVPVDCEVFPVLLEVPSVRLFHLSRLVQFVLGVAGFARVHAQRAAPDGLRDKCPELALPLLKWTCVHCYCISGDLYVDSEWHMMLECPLHTDERSRLYHSEFRFFLDKASHVDTLAGMVLFAGGDARRLERFCVALSNMLRVRRGFLVRRDLPSRVREAYERSGLGALGVV